MIWVIFFFFLFFFNLKSNFFLANLFFLDPCFFFIAVVCVLMMFFTNYFLFPFFCNLEKEFYVSMFFSLVFFVALSFSLSSPFLFIFCVEFTFIFMLFLFLNFSKDQDKISAFMYMFFINLAGSIPFFFFSLAYLNNFAVSYIFNFLLVSFIDFIFFFSFLLVLCSKLPLLFFHFWLPKAHVSAFGMCSILLAGLMLKLGSFGIFKFFSLVVLPAFFSATILVSMGLFCSLFFVFLMVRFSDIKHLVACSSILHMSFIVPALFISSTLGVSASLAMNVGHGIVSPVLFFIVTLLYEGSLNRSQDCNKSSSSFSKFFSLFIFLFVFLNMGVPPFLNFFSEMLYCSVFYSYSLFSLAFLSVSMLASVIFSMFMILKTFFGKKFSSAFKNLSLSSLVLNLVSLGFLFVSCFLL